MQQQDTARMDGDRLPASIDLWRPSVDSVLVHTLLGGHIHQKRCFGAWVILSFNWALGKGQEGNVVRDQAIFIDIWK